MARPAPAPGAAPLPAPDAGALLRRNAASPDIADRQAIRFGDERWTHAEYGAESCRWANLFLSTPRFVVPDAASRRQSAPQNGAERPLHVGVLLDNTPEYLFALGGAAYAGATIVGLNPTRSGDALLRDIDHTDIDLVVTEAGHLDDLAGLDLGDRPVLVAGESLDEALAAVPPDDPGLDHDPATPWALVFTSGTSGSPKAVICSQRRLMVTGSRMVTMMGLGPDDVGYVAMPLFHSNALMVGWIPSVVAGASVALARRFSVSAFLPDVRRYGATWFNYTGKPLSYLIAPEPRPDDADNPLRVAFGNEGSPAVLDEFSRRFGVEVIDAFGSTEGAIALDRSGPDRTGAMGVAGPTIRIVDADDHECPPAKLDADGRLLNAEECVGEIVNTAGPGPFEGYYNNDEATAQATRNGWYWSGDLGYLDEERYLFFAGRTAEWIRVDGENFPAGPIADAIAAHPDVVVAAAYGVPDVQAGDQVMAAVVLRAGSAFDPDGFASWIDEQPTIAPKWRPRYVRVAAELPTTGTNKIVTRVLTRQKFRLDLVGDDELWARERGHGFRRFGPAAERGLLEAFVDAGRERFWDL